MASSNMLNGLSKQQAQLLLDGLLLVRMDYNAHLTEGQRVDIKYLESQLENVKNYHDATEKRDAEWKAWDKKHA